MNSGTTLQNKNMVFDIYKAAITRASKLRTAKCHDRAILAAQITRSKLTYFIVLTQFI